MDMSQTIDPKSEQLNADDLIGGPRTITITRVSGNEGNAEQPVNIYFEGDRSRPFRPCKTMRRLLVDVWGADGNAYVGRSMTIYRDPHVKWGGNEVGGIRISHVSHIDRDKTVVLTLTRAQRKPHVIKPLRIENGTSAPAQDMTAQHQAEARRAAQGGTEAFTAWYTDKSDPNIAAKQSAAKLIVDELKQTAADADATAVAPDPFSDMTGEDQGDAGEAEQPDHSAFIEDLRSKLAIAADLEEVDFFVGKKADQITAIRASDELTGAEIDTLIEARKRELG